MGLLDKLFGPPNVKKLEQKGDVEGLIKALCHEDKDVRQKAAEALGRMGDVRAVEPLILALKDSESDVAADAAGALGKIGDVRAVEPLVLALKDLDNDFRKQVAWALGKIGDARAIETLIGALKDSDEYVRREAGEALKGLKPEAISSEADKSLLPMLMEELKDWRTQVREASAMLLGKIGDVQAVEPLILALKDSDYDVRWDAAEALGGIGDARAVDPLIQALKDRSGSVRGCAAQALGKITDARAVDPLIATIIYDESFQVREAATDALLKISNTSILVDLLIAAFKYADYKVRNEVLKILDLIKWEPIGIEKIYYLIAKGSFDEVINEGNLAVDPLILSLQFRDDFVRQRAAKALFKIGDARAIEPLIFTAATHGGLGSGINFYEMLNEFGDRINNLAVRAVEILLKLLKDQDDDVRGGAYWILMKDHSIVSELINSASSKSLLPMLMEELKDWRTQVRGVSAFLIGKIGDARAVEPLIQALQDSDSWVRSGAARALGKIGDVRAIESLISVLQDSDKDVRKESAEALGEIGDARAIESLISMLQDSDKDVREETAEALGKIGDVRAIEPLILLLQDSDSWVRNVASDALQKIGGPLAEEAFKGYEVKKAVEKLVYLYDQSPRGEGFYVDSSSAEPVRKIGAHIDELGGFKLMLKVHTRFAELRPYAKRNLEMVWDNIGNWLG
jgi:HEAT repeat protein